MMASQDTPAKAFHNLLSAFNIEKTEFRGRTAYKFETGNIAELLGGLTECHDKLYRIILTMHISALPKDERVEAIKGLRKFTDSYLDSSTAELIEALNDGEMVGTAFRVVK